MINVVFHMFIRPQILREEKTGLIDNMCSDKDDFGVLEYCGGYCYNATVEYESKYLRCKPHFML